MLSYLKTIVYLRDVITSLENDIINLEKIIDKEIPALDKRLKKLEMSTQKPVIAKKRSRPVVLSSVSADSSSITLTVPKKRGRPVGSKNKISTKKK
jgi:hypothetical protein